MKCGPIILGWGDAIGKGPFHLKVSEFYTLSRELDAGLETNPSVAGEIGYGIYA